MREERRKRTKLVSRKNVKCVLHDLIIIVEGAIELVNFFLYFMFEAVRGGFK
jgi:hypothetical protein